MKTHAINIFALIILIFAIPRGVKADDLQPKGEDTQVSVAEIGRTVTLVGRLGRPLGTMLSVRGTWRLPEGRSKDNSLSFIVSHVDGQKLESPVAFHINDMSVQDARGRNAKPPLDEHALLDGETWTLRGYETGRVTRIPAEFWTESRRSIPAMRGEPPFASQFVSFRQSK